MLNAARQLEATSRKWLLQWDSDTLLLEEGSQITLPNKPASEKAPSFLEPWPKFEENGNLLVRIPCPQVAPGVVVPVGIALNAFDKEMNQSYHHVRVPRGIIHLSAYSCGAFGVCHRRSLCPKERNLNETL